MAGGQGVARRRRAPRLNRPLRIAVNDTHQARDVVAWAAAVRRGVKLYGRNAQASGPAFWQAAEEVLGRPVVVMCGDRAGTVLAALRVGCRHLHHTVQGPAAAALTALIAAHGAREAPELPHVVLTAHPQVTAQIARWRFEHSDQFRRGCYESAHLSHDPNSNGMTPCD